MGKLEKHLEARCNAYAESEGWMHIKLDRAKRGWPDRMYFGPCGAMLLIEFKLPGEKVRPQQQARHEQLFILGHPVNVVREFPEFEHLLQGSQALADCLAHHSVQ